MFNGKGNARYHFEERLRLNPPPQLVNRSVVTGENRAMLDALLAEAEAMGIDRALAVSIIHKWQR